jgi:hypothetical protein
LGSAIVHEIYLHVNALKREHAALGGSSARLSVSRFHALIEVQVLGITFGGLPARGTVLAQYLLKYLARIVW